MILLCVICSLALATGTYLLGRKHGSARSTRFLEHPGLDRDSNTTAGEMTATDQMLYDKCCKYMTERKPFLVESFSLGDLAAAMYTNKAYLSKTINYYSGMNFRHFLNHYRVMYAVDLFRRDSHLRVNDLAELSGFHSATTFSHAFGDVMKEPPSAWCARVRSKKMTKGTKQS